MGKALQLEYYTKGRKRGREEGKGGRKERRKTVSSIIPHVSPIL